MGVVRYFFYPTEFASTKSRIDHSPTSFTNRMYSGVYDDKGNRVGLTSTSNFYTVLGAIKHVTTESVLWSPIGQFVTHYNISTKGEYVEHDVQERSHYVSNNKLKNVSIFVSPPSSDPTIPRTIEINFDPF